MRKPGLTTNHNRHGQDESGRMEDLLTRTQIPWRRTVSDLLARRGGEEGREKASPPNGGEAPRAELTNHSLIAVTQRADYQQRTTWLVVCGRLLVNHHYRRRCWLFVVGELTTNFAVCCW
jgi:hypothetical protein